MQIGANRPIIATECHRLKKGDRIVNSRSGAGRSFFLFIYIVEPKWKDHRASTDHEPRSIYGKIVAEADRIIDPDITLRRTVQYGLKQNPTTDEEWHYLRFHKHLMEKYAPGGYLKLWFPNSKNAERLKELQTIIADETLLKSVFHRLYAEERR